MQATVLILTKLPGLLPVKTRLWPVLGEEGAKRAYLEWLDATIELARQLTDRVRIAYSPANAEPPGPGYVPVEGEDGATCLENAVAAAFDGSPLIVLGGDAPDLPRSRLEDVLAALSTHDAAFVPTGDGGFSCLGLKRPVPDLAGAFEFGGRDTLASLVGFFESCGLSIFHAEPWPDIDTPADLEAYRARVRQGRR